MKSKARTSVIVFFFIATLLPTSVVMTKSSAPPALESPTAQDVEIDLDWLRGEVGRVFAENKVTQVRDWKGTAQEVTYHAPSLASSISYPQGLPGWLHWLWKVRWLVRAPWEVRFPHQWFWDSNAHAIALSHLDPRLAVGEIDSLLYAQEPSGFIPHMIWNPEEMHWVDRLLRLLYPSRHTSPYIQPPNLAQAVERIYEESGDLAFLKRVLPRLKEYYLYLDWVRNPDGDGLPEIVISYETGKDRSPEYDVVYGDSNAKSILRGPMLRLMLKQRRMGWDVERILASDGFRVKDTLFCAIYAQNLSILSHLYAIVGQREESDLFREMGRKTEASILAKMYDEETGLFYSLDARGGEDKQIKMSTVSSLMPLLLRDIGKSQVERLVRDYLLNPDEFWLEYPVPAVPASSPSKEGKERLIWRGLQTWVYTNWYIAQGLRQQALRFPEHFQEYNQIADELTAKTYELVRREGFREFYDARTGEGQGAYLFGSSTLILDMVYNIAKE